MGKLVFGFVLLAIAFFLRLGAATVGTQGSSGRPVGGVLRGLSYVALVLGVVIALGSALVVATQARSGSGTPSSSWIPSPCWPASGWALGGLRSSASRSVRRRI